MRLLESITQFDTRMFLWVTGSKHQQGLAKTARMVSRSGDGYLQIALPLLLVFLGLEHATTLFQTVIVAFAIQLPIYWVLKNSFKRKRPPQAIPSFRAFIVASDEFSFPSGHTSAAFLLTFLIASFYGMAALPLLAWAICVGASRVILGVHFPTDIVAGILLASCSASLSLSLLGLN